MHKKCTSICSISIVSFTCVQCSADDNDFCCLFYNNSQTSALFYASEHKIVWEWLNWKSKHSIHSSETNTQNKLDTGESQQILCLIIRYRIRFRSQKKLAHCSICHICRQTTTTKNNCYWASSSSNNNRFDGYSPDETACDLYVIGNKINHIYTVNLVATSCSRWVFDTHKQSQRIHSQQARQREKERERNIRTQYIPCISHDKQNSSSRVRTVQTVFVVYVPAKKWLKAQAPNQEHIFQAVENVLR